jgi:hypothetical protein
VDSVFSAFCAAPPVARREIAERDRDAVSAAAVRPRADRAPFIMFFAAALSFKSAHPPLHLQPAIFSWLLVVSEVSVCTQKNYII